MWGEISFYGIRIGIPVVVIAIGIMLNQVEPKVEWVILLLLFSGVMSLLLFPVELIERWLKIDLIEQLAKAMGYRRY